MEHLAACLAIPGLLVVRPGDANEVAEAWRVLLQFRHAPACLILTRQALPTLDRTKYAAASGLAKGAYVLADPKDGAPEVLLLATGSEVYLCTAAHEQLAQEGIRSRVVSMPSWEIFESQPQEYRDAVLPPGVKARVSVEQASTLGWAALGSDHAGFPLKERLLAQLRPLGHELLDLGTHDTTPVDYPSFAAAVGSAVRGTAPNGVCCFAAAAWERRSLPISFRVCEPGYATTRTRPTRASSTTT